MVRCVSIWPIRSRNTVRRRSAAAERFATARRCSASAAAPSSDQFPTLVAPTRSGGSDQSRMSEPIFLRQSAGFTLDEIAGLTGAAIASRSAPDARRIVNIAPLDRAAPYDLTFLDSRNYVAAAAATHAGACLTTAALAKESAEPRVSADRRANPIAPSLRSRANCFRMRCGRHRLSKAGDFAGAHVDSSARHGKRRHGRARRGDRSPGRNRQRNC